MPPSSFNSCTTESSCSSEDKEEDYKGNSFCSWGVVGGCPPPPLPGQSPGGSVEPVITGVMDISEVLLFWEPESHEDHKLAL